VLISAKRAAAGKWANRELASTATTADPSCPTIRPTIRLAPSFQQHFKPR